MISIKTHGSFYEVYSRKWLLTTVGDFFEKFKGLEETYHSQLKKSKESRDRMIITMLWFANAELVHTLDNLKKARRSYQKLRRDTLEARNARLLPSVVDDIIQDTYLHRELQNRADEFAFILESLVETARDMVQDGDFKSISANIRGLSSDLLRLAEDIPRSLERHLRLLEIRQNVQDSRSQWILTVLASVFLPLSLACSLLSMQTRFRDLHYLLYDFCGVVVILLTVVALILLWLKVAMWVIDYVMDRKRKSQSKLVRLVLTSIPWLLVVGVISVVWPIFLASFIVGMVHDVRLGGLILGYGLAAVVGVYVVFLVLTGLVGALS